MYIFSFRGVKMCKIGKKGVFLVMLTYFGKDMNRQIKEKKKHAKMHI